MAAASLLGEGEARNSSGTLELADEAMSGRITWLGAERRDGVVFKQGDLPAG